MGAPGWPELLFATISAARVRIVAMEMSSVFSGVNFDMVVVKVKVKRAADMI
jgi:hypothetical protein